MTGLIGVAAVVLVAWFAAGTAWNVRLGSALMRWMQDGLPALGKRTTVRWLGSSAVELVLNDPEPPFSSVTIVLFLEPRDLPWWPLSRLRGRRDTLIVRAVLKRAPAAEFEALDPASWSGRDARPRVAAGWQTTRKALEIHHESARALELAEALLPRAAGLEVRRLSVRRAEPHFQLHAGLPDRGKPARALFETIRALGEAALK